jgi:hypothetical protein
LLLFSLPLSLSRLAPSLLLYGLSNLMSGMEVLFEHNVNMRNVLRTCSFILLLISMVFAVLIYFDLY